MPNSPKSGSLSFALLGALAATLVSAPLYAQAGQPAPGSREAMWPAPTEADWAKPCLIFWQRTFEDAVVVARETGKPILICVNMDGEIASEHYAGIRYREPEKAKLYEPYVTVIASVYRHTPRDFDERGARIPCPRFGSVTCGEHIAIEPGLFDGFFEGQRVAPRHVMVELEESGSYAESYDVYYAFDTDSVFETIRVGIANRPAPPELPDVERVLDELVTSRDNADRIKLEEAYQSGDVTVRRRLLKALAREDQPTQTGLLRLALYDLDLDLVKLARLTLAKAETAESVDLIMEALRVPTSEEERESLIAALERIGESSQRARTLAVVHRGLVATSETVDVSSWTQAIEGAEPEEVRNGLPVSDPKLEYKAQAAIAHPEDPSTKLELGEAYLSYAVDPENTGLLAPRAAEANKYKRLLFEDALRAAERARELGSESWRVEAIAALAHTYLGRRLVGYEHAKLAAGAMPPGAEGWTAMATLALFAESRQRDIWKAERGQTPWSPEWLTDINAAYSVLAQSPYGTAAQVVAHYDFLWQLGVGEQADLVLEDGLDRFPSSWELHARLRASVFKRGGLEQLEAVYAERLGALDAQPEFVWYAGYASLIAAEFHRRGTNPDGALGAYGRGIDFFEQALEMSEDGEVRGADHYIAMALAGRARLALEREDFAKATEQILASFERRSAAAATLDGLGFTPVSTAQMLLSRLKRAEQNELAATVQAALDALDPELLILPAFENVGARRGRGNGAGRPNRQSR